MADPIQLLSAARAHKDLSHQISAWRQLQQRLSKNDPAALVEFAELFRADPPAKPQPSPTPGVDWLTPCLAIVKEFEGCKLTAYPDPGTGGEPWTIGWGSTGPGIGPGTVWTQKQADERLMADLREFHHGVLTVLPMAAEWSGNRQAALTSFAYNIGIGALQESTLRRRLIAGEDPNTVVREELPRWNKGGSGVMPGLVRRRAAEVALFVGGQQQEQQPGRVRPGDPFSTRLSAHFTLGEFALGQEARRFTAQHQVDTAAELAAFLERVRSRFGKPVVITSGYRPPAINRSVGGASQSEHLYDAPGVGAVDFYVDGATIGVVQDWCDKEWPYSVGYGAPKGFVHLGIRKGRPRVRWDY
jgi:GH24 family phage-related lysozyme (muramidase)